MEINVILDITSSRKAFRFLYRKKLLIAIIPYILIITYGIVEIITNRNNKDNRPNFQILVLIIGLIGLIVLFIRMNKHINLKIKQMRQIYDGNSCEYLFRFTKEAVIDKNLKSGNVSSVKYIDIVKCIESRDIILFISNFKLFTYIPKNSINNLQRENIINLVKNKNISYKRVK